LRQREEWWAVQDSNLRLRLCESKGHHRFPRLRELRFLGAHGVLVGAWVVGKLTTFASLSCAARRGTPRYCGTSKNLSGGPCRIRTCDFDLVTRQKPRRSDDGKSLLPQYSVTTEAGNLATITRRKSFEHVSARARLSAA